MTAQAARHLAATWVDPSSGQFGRGGAARVAGVDTHEIDFARLAARVAANVTVRRNDGESSVLGQLGNLFE